MQPVALVDYFEGPDGRPEPVSGAVTFVYSMREVCAKGGMSVN